MTYCVGMRLNQGLVFMSDTRTNVVSTMFLYTRSCFAGTCPEREFSP